MIYNYILLFMFYSILGWIMEVCVSLYTKKRFVNRGFLIGPYCPIYGVGVTLITIFLTKYKDDILTLFVMTIALCTVLEYMTSYIMEKLFHARWWDYSQKKFNLNGRVCLETMLPFGVIGTIAIYLVNPILKRFIDMMPLTFTKLLSISLVVIVVADIVVSLIVMSNLNKAKFTIKKDSTEEVSKKVKDMLTNKNFFTKRLVDAFPNFEVLMKKTQDTINKTKQEIKNKQREIKKMRKSIKKNEKQLKKLHKKGSK